MDVSMPIGALTGLLKALWPSAVQGNSRALTAHLRECFCDFQRDYANYAFYCAQAHREFKEAWRAGDEVATRGCYGRLVTAVDDGLAPLCVDHAQMVQAYFRLTRRTSVLPKVGIHVMDDAGAISPLGVAARPFLKADHPRDRDDTLLECMVATGLPYLDQCLPKTARTDSGYHHRCLDLGRARGHYRQRWWDRPLLARWRLNLLCRSPLDKDWQDCWSGLQGGEVAYKSVLAVPITFRQHASRQKLGRKLVEVLDLPEEGRAILGFLIVDHPASYYFDDPPADSFENLDVNVLYLFADTLSLALLTARTYTTASTTVRSYLETRQAQEQ